MENEEQNGHAEQVNNVSEKEMVQQQQVIGEDVVQIQQNKAEITTINSKKQKRINNYTKKQTQTIEQNAQVQEKSSFNACREKVLVVAQHSVSEIVMTICTLYALYFDDIRILAFTKGADNVFYTITFICLILFFLEFSVFTIVKPGYPLSFSFWMDLVSSLSLIFDIPWLSSALFGLQLEGGEAQADLLKAGRVSRVTTRAAKLVRFIRLIRLIRVGKLYKHAFEALNERVEKYMDEQAQDEDLEMLEQPKLNEKLLNKFDDKDIQPSDDVKSNNENSNEKGKKKKVKKTNSKQQEPISAEQQKTNQKQKMSVVGIMNKEYDERARKFAFGRSKSTVFINPDIIGMETQSDDSEYGGKRKKNPGQFIQEEEVSGDKETKISKKLSDLTTKRVITLIFSVMISIPFFSRETYDEDITSFETGLQLMYLSSAYAPSSGSYNPTLLEHYKSYYQSYHETEEERYPIFRVQMGSDQTFIKGSKYDELKGLRTSEYQVFAQDIASSSPDLKSNEGIGSFVSIKIDTDLNAGLSLLRTTFLIFLLSAAAVFFTKDSNELVLNPIERMLNKVKRIGANPLEAARMAEDEAVAEEEYKQILDKEKLRQKQTEKNFETSILETTIIKIGALLALGFGEAGSEIIAKNMNREGAVNPMIAGRKIMAIFGFVAIRNFIDATEALEERVMIYANEIAEIVHKVCDRYHGAANKNLGDCFLMVWKFKDDDFIKLNDNDEVEVKNLKIVKNYSDQAVIAFLKTMAACKKQSQYGTMNLLIQDIQKKYPKFSMNLGFGLHMGWGIEGAIGSEYKIDASYLSPNVNLASRLEYATKQYGVPILISGQIYRILSNKTQSYLRQVDRVTVKGSKQPMDLYTCDMDHNRLEFSQPPRKVYRNKKVIRVVARHRKQENLIQIMKNRFQVSSILEKDIELIQMRSYYKPDFIDTFHEALDLYLDGFWTESRKILLQASQILQAEYTKQGGVGEIQDGPTQTLINFMGEFKYKAPRTWKGYRSLTDK